MSDRSRAWIRADPSPNAYVQLTWLQAGIGHQQADVLQRQFDAEFFPGFAADRCQRGLPRVHVPADRSVPAGGLDILVRRTLLEQQPAVRGGHGGPDRGVVLGLSGGIDSSCLAVELAARRPRAVTFQFCARGENPREAAWRRVRAPSWNSPRM